MSPWKRYGPLVGLALVIVLSLGMVMLSSATSSVRPIAGGVFEASGAIVMDGGALVVDDGRTDSLQWMALDDAGQQVGPARTVALGLSITDMEGITTDGTYVYVVGSQSKKNSASTAGIARVRFDPATLRVSDQQAVSGLRALVLDAVPEVARAAGTRADGFNIEGLAWDPQRRELLLGLRAPVIDGHALAVPLRLKDAAGPFARENIVVGSADVARLSLGGGGIRSIEFDEHLRTYRIISGASRNEEWAFAAWRWTRSDEPTRDQVDAALLTRELKPEGIAPARPGEHDYTLLVFDSGAYAALR